MKAMIRFALAVCFIGSFSSISYASQLIMVDSRACVFCGKFKRDLGREYPESAAGKVAPLRRISALRKWPEDLSHIKRTPYTPVFILVSDNGREIGRFFGYQDRDTFYAELNGLLKKR